MLIGYSLHLKLENLGFSILGSKNCKVLRVIILMLVVSINKRLYQKLSKIDLMTRDIYAIREIKRMKLYKKTSTLNRTRKKCVAE